jgi:hypothetical protein
MKSFLRMLGRFWREEDGAWFIPLLLAIIFQVVAYLLTPKPKKAKPEAAKDMEDPTADAGRPIPVVFGTVTVKGLNILHFGDKNKLTREVNA